MKLFKIIRAWSYDSTTKLRIKSARNLLDYLKESTEGKLSLFYNDEGEKIRGMSNGKVRQVKPEEDWTTKYL